MKAQRSGMTRRALAALTALPLAIAMSGCQLGIRPYRKPHNGYH